MYPIVLTILMFSAMGLLIAGAMWLDRRERDKHRQEWINEGHTREEAERWNQ